MAMKVQGGKMTDTKGGAQFAGEVGRQQAKQQINQLQGITSQVRSLLGTLLPKMIALERGISNNIADEFMEAKKATQRAQDDMQKADAALVRAWNQLS